VARLVLAGAAPEQEAYLDVTAGVIFAGGRASRRAIRASLAPPGRSTPTSFGAQDVSYVVGFLLSVLNGVACNLLAAEAGDAVSGWRAKWRAWRRRRAIAASTAPDGLQAPLPRLTAIQAAQVGGEVMRLAQAAGIADEQAQRVSTLIASALMGSE
jgi:hypothetical protein